MKLSQTQSRYLRRLGHALDPVVLVGAAGLSPGVLAEIDRALEHHELIKVRVRVDDRAARDAMLAELATGCSATLVQRIGHVALIYRPAEHQKIFLPASGG